MFKTEKKIRKFCLVENYSFLFRQKSSQFCWGDASASLLLHWSAMKAVWQQGALKLRITYLYQRVISCQSKAGIRGTFSRIQITFRSIIWLMYFIYQNCFQHGCGLRNSKWGRLQMCSCCPKLIFFTFKSHLMFLNFTVWLNSDRSSSEQE